MKITMMMSTSLVKSHMLERQSHIFQIILNKQQHISTLSGQTIAAAVRVHNHHQQN